MATYAAHETALSKFGYVNLHTEYRNRRKVRYFRVLNDDYDVELPITLKELRKLQSPDDPMMSKVATWIEEQLKTAPRKPALFYILIPLNDAAKSVLNEH